MQVSLLIDKIILIIKELIIETAGLTAFGYCSNIGSERFYPCGSRSPADQLSAKNKRIKGENYQAELAVYVPWV